MTSLIESQRRRLLRHGFIFLFMGAWLGIATAILPHPRAWLAVHLTAFLTCLILVAIGLVWRELDLTERQRSIGLIAGFTSAYLGLAGNIFSARWICRDRRRSRGPGTHASGSDLLHIARDRRAGDADRFRTSHVRDARGA